MKNRYYELRMMLEECHYRLRHRPIDAREEAYFRETIYRLEDEMRRIEYDKQEYEPVDPAKKKREERKKKLNRIFKDE